MYLVVGDGATVSANRKQRSVFISKVRDQSDRRSFAAWIRNCPAFVRMSWAFPPGARGTTSGNHVRYFMRNECSVSASVRKDSSGESVTVTHGLLSAMIGSGFFVLLLFSFFHDDEWPRGQKEKNLVNRDLHGFCWKMLFRSRQK